MQKGEWEELDEAQRERAFTVAKVSRMRVLQTALDGIAAAIRDGTTLEDFREKAAEGLIRSWGGEIPGRIENIFRTNVLTSYAQGRHAINTAPAVREARPYWRYDDTQSDRECEECSACGGVVLPADDPWWATHTPLLHHQCECTITALSDEEAQEEGVDEEGPEVEVDEGFGAEPSSVGQDWEADLSNLDPELRELLEE
jgi:uncharacterized protein with gpF-like domain